MIKQAKQLKCDVNSKQFRDVLRYVWMPRLLEQVQTGPGYCEPNRPEFVHHHQNTSHSSVSGTEWPKTNNSSESSSLEFQAPSISDHDVSKVLPSFNNQVPEQGNSSSGGGGDDDCDDSLETFLNDESMWVLEQLSEDFEIKYNLLA